MWEYDVPYLGYKYNGNSIMAQIARVSLKYLRSDNDYRRKISSIYESKLSKNKNIFMIPHCKWSSRHLFSILVKNRSKIIKKLKLKKINPGYITNQFLNFLIIKKNLSKDARTCLFQKI